MTERYRITSVQASKTLTTGKPTVSLYGDTRLRYPVLTLFDPGMLILIGIDPASITTEKTPVALWAYYETAEKTNKDGVAYKDIVSLEQINAPATATSVDTSAILGELRAIKALLLALTRQPETRQPETLQPADPAKTARLRTLAHAGSATADPPAEVPETVKELETSDLTPGEARAEFYRLAGEAIPAGTIDPQVINDLVKDANGSGFVAALAALRQKLA